MARAVHIHTPIHAAVAGRRQTASSTSSQNRIGSLAGRSHEGGTSEQATAVTDPMLMAAAQASVIPRELYPGRCWACEAHQRSLTAAAHRQDALRFFSCVLRGVFRIDRVRRVVGGGG